MKRSLNASHIIGSLTRLAFYLGMSDRERFHMPGHGGCASAPRLARPLVARKSNGTSASLGVIVALSDMYLMFREVLVALLFCVGVFPGKDQVQFDVPDSLSHFVVRGHPLGMYICDVSSGNVFSEKDIMKSVVG